MISTILDTIKAELISLKMNESEMFFNSDNIPASIIDNSFVISPVIIENGTEPGATADGPFNNQLLNIQTPIKILYHRQFTATNNYNVIKDAGTKIEKIVKKLLKIAVGSNATSQIEYIGSSYAVIDKRLIYEIDFLINYRLENF